MELREISEEELTEVLSEHKKWLDSNGKKGKRADLDYTDLSGINLSRANLSRANLSGAYLWGAILSGANLSGADLSGASLSESNLSGANLSGADLWGANLSGTDLSESNLSGADLSGAKLLATYLFGTDLSEANLFRANLSKTDLSRADLSGANLSEANLWEADLSEANLSGADLYFANLRNAKLENVKYDDTTQYFALQCPEKGEFVAYKKAYDSESGLSRIVKLLIPADALRSSATSKKCRCNKAKVLSITSLDDKIKCQKAYSSWDHSFIYEVGETVEVSDFDKNRWRECAPGIHFFMNIKDALSY